MKECRIGSLPWFAGVFWLVLSCAAHAAATLAFKARLNRVAWLLIHATMRCNREAMACAVEGGAEE